MASFLILYGSTHGQTAKVAAYMRAVLVERGDETTVRHVRNTTDASLVSTHKRTGTWAALVAMGLLVSAYHLVVRPWYLNWGATDEESTRRLPGDDLVPTASSETTRAITIEAPCDEVWPWVVQLGQGRGGFYSYSLLENLAGADIHNVDRVVPELQHLEVGDSIRMAKEDYWLQSPLTTMTVERIDQGRTLVLRGYDGGTWTFHLEPIDAETTRFVVRGRTPANQSFLDRLVRYLAYELPHFIMERGMMRGIKARAERPERVGDSASE